MSLHHLLRYAQRNLRQGGQRLLIAILSIAFGVMSLVGMSTLADVLNATMMADARYNVGGDMMVWPKDSFLTAEQIAIFDQWQQDGIIAEYTISTSNHNLFYHNPVTGKAQFPMLARGIDPASYPLVGEFVLQGDPTADPTALLQQSGDLLITRDIAHREALAVGDALILASNENPVPHPFRIVGILQDTPTHNGDSLFYSRESANQLLGYEVLGSRIHLTLGSQPLPAQWEEMLDEADMWPFTAQDATNADTQTQAIFNLAFKGAGLLGLMVGGIGIANTMQLLLARRTKEVAVLKALGYSQRDLHWLFLIETAVLGIIGTVLGLLLAAVLSYGLVYLFGNITTYLMVWRLYPTTLLLGLIVGMVTTLIFALWAIVRVSRVHPSALLRNEPVSVAQMGRLNTLLLLLGLLLPFAIVMSIVLGSVLQGIGVLLFAVAGLVVVGGTFALLLWFVARFLPTGRFYLLKLATNRLRRQGFGLVFAMIALFAGLVTLALVTVMIQTTQNEMDLRTMQVTGPNLVLLFPEERLEAVRPSVEPYAPLDVAVRRLGQVTDVYFRLPDGTTIEHAPLLVTQSSGWEASTAVANGRADYHPYVSYYGFPEGTVVEIVAADGSQHTLPAGQAYELAEVLPTTPGQTPLLVDEASFAAWTNAVDVQLILQLPSDRVSQDAVALRQALPDLLVLNMEDWVASLAQAYRNLYWLALAMASLALLAGMLLVANAVTLAMLSRRQEMGVLQALGYGRRQILTATLLEYGLMAAIASGVTLIAVYLFLLALPFIEPEVEGLFALSPSTAVSLFGLGIVLTAVAALASAWQPTKVSPNILLTDQT